MARDYKHRAQQRDREQRKRNQKEANGVGVIRTMLITAVVIGFAVFLIYLKSQGSDGTKLGKQVLTTQQLAAKTKQAQLKTANLGSGEIKPKEQKPPPPQFDFYTILPKKEVIVPEHELKTRTLEERAGKQKKASYLIQVGSSRDLNDADQLKAKLALMGIESKIQKAKVESVVWYRVKVGPYTQMSSVNTVISRLQKNGMKPIITEVDG